MVVLRMMFNSRSHPIVGILVLVIVAPAVAYHTTRASAGQGGAGQTPSRRSVHVVAERFLFTPSEITVEAGSTLEIRLTSEDTDHGFRILGTDIDVEIPKRGRGEATVVFQPAEAGDYTFECSRMCGAGHSFMRGRIRVKPRAQASRGVSR
jgi:cytochrome c oxidase subunit 2